jgi:NDP-sugar pyrophosphorylase family protein
MIPALVLTAGLATRLRPLSLVRAKAALPIAGEPLARRILRTLRAGGVTDAVLNLHWLPHTLSGRIGDGADLGMRVRYSWEMPVLGSAGGPRHALPLLASAFHARGSSSSSGSTFLIVNGDTLTDLDIAAIVDDHRRSGALVTMAVIPNTEPDKYGGVVVDESAVVTGFVRRGSTQPSYHFIGVQVAEGAAFASLPDNTPYESVGALYPALMGERRDAIRAHISTAEFFDIGTAADYLETALLLSARDGHASPHGARSRIHPAARVEQSILWDDVEIGDGALLRHAIVADGVRIPADTSWIGVTIRRAEGELAPNEKRIDDLAVAEL